MLKKLSKTLFFYIAFLPLIAALTVKVNPPLFIAVSIVLFSLLVLILVWQMLKAIKTLVPAPTDVNVVELKNSELLTFIFTFILPLLGFDTDVRTLISFFIIFFIIGYIYIGTSLFCINPLLKIIFGYNIYEIFVDESRGYLLSKSKFSYRDHQLNIVRLEYNIYIHNQ